MPPLTVVFDLDGTLVDTAPDLIDTLNVVSRARRTAARALCQGAQHDRRRRPPHDRGGTYAREARGHRRRRSTGCSRISSPTTPRTSPTVRGRFPGSIAALDQLAARRAAALAVCTNKLEGLSRLLLDALGLTPRFAAICGQDTFGMQKPDPEILRRTIAAGRRQRGTGDHGRGFGHRHRDRPRRRRAGRGGRFRLQRNAGRPARARPADQPFRRAAGGGVRPGSSEALEPAEIRRYVLIAAKAERLTDRFTLVRAHLRGILSAIHAPWRAMGSAAGAAADGRMRP